MEMFFQNPFLRCQMMLVNTSSAVLEGEGWNRPFCNMGVITLYSLVPTWDRQGLEPKERVLLTVPEKQGEKEGGVER